MSRFTEEKHLDGRMLANELRKLRLMATAMAVALGVWVLWATISIAEISHLREDVGLLRWENEILRTRTESQRARLLVVYAMLGKEYKEDEQELPKRMGTPGKAPGARP